MEKARAGSERFMKVYLCERRPFTGHRTTARHTDGETKKPPYGVWCSQRLVDNTNANSGILTARDMKKFVVLTKLFMYSPKCLQPTKKPKLVSLVARPGMVPYGRYKNLPLETRANEHFPIGELNAKMRFKKVFDFGVF